MTPDGRELFGVEAFTQWCTQRKYDVAQKAQEYIEVYKKYNSGDIEKEGLDATSKVINAFTKQNTYLDKLIYLYPYSLPVFGKTKISEMLFHAKQSQDEKLMRKTFDMMREKLLSLIEHIQPDAIGFIPPTLMRKKQIMKELQNYLSLDFPFIQIQKIKTPITVQQKSLKNIDDRIMNADKTMIVLNTKTGAYKKVLLIDDFTGSGSTLNEIAKKIKKQDIAKVVIGLTLTGSLNGFDVIREI
jgi:predicted amidophosphoribosyltransferase